MERHIALEKLQLILGQDLWELAKQYPDLTLMNKEGKQQKGWAGHVIERYLQLPLNSAQSPNFGSWELKVIPLRFNRKGELIVKETMAITMIDAVNVLQTPFEESHLLSKLRKQIVVARIDDEVTVKRLKKQGNTVQLLPENSEFSPIVVDLREQAFSIEGLAVGLIRPGGL
jgi:DNA mismatch repair protein MutH